MAKEEPGRLFSKVAKFVRNPLKDWSELDAEDASTLDNSYSREMLKEMIERRQRNDFVRRREFDMLRKLRQREAAGDRDAAGTPSSLNISSTSGKTAGRALTLKKIDEIEEQMSQQWWKGRGPKGDASAADATSQGSSDMSVQHARAYADTEPDVPADADAAKAARAVYDGSIEEAAIRFAHGDDSGAEAILLQALAPEGASAAHDGTWRALFDLYRATGDTEKFEAAAARHAQRMKQASPAWFSLRDLARETQASTAAGAKPARAAPKGDADWVCPPTLTREGLRGLTQALTDAGPTWKLDWSPVRIIDSDSVGPLRALFAHWADSAVQLRFSGVDSLLLVLAEATPVNDRGVDVAWWQLHMAALRVMHRPDEFELLALNYCITYEVSPPPWEDPKGEFSSIEAPGSSGVSPNSMRNDLNAEPALPPPGHAVLAGELVGESHPIWARLDAELADAGTLSVSCAALIRMDFAAAGTLLNWVTARDERGQRVQFVDTHRLISAFFGVIGIADHAAVAIRKD